MFRPTDLYCLFAAAVWICSTSTAAQEDAEDSPYRPGLVATYSAGGKTAARTDEVVAFDWQDAACDPRLPAGDFTATWRGRLWARGAGTYRLSCYVQGEVEVELAAKTIISGRADQPQWLSSQPLELEFDYHALEITFRKTQLRGQLALFWSGPDFRLEPIPERSLVHEREQAPSTDFERGRQLADALRCAACHQDSAASVTPAPSLDRLSGNVHESWLVDWLSSHATNGNKVPRRMPDLAMTKQEAQAVAAWLLRDPPAQPVAKKMEQKGTKATKDEGKKKGGKKGKSEEQPRPSVEAGERLILSRGCLACHKFGEFGDSGLFGGGDLTAIAAKRPADFLTRWLEDPAAINRHHRMPQFTFTADEMTSLSLWDTKQALSRDQTWSRSGDTSKQRQGEKLVTSLRCAACHALTREGEAPAEPARHAALTAASNWTGSCAAQPNREKSQPGYRLATEDQSALKAYYSQPRPGENRLSSQARGRDLLVQLNCLACHQREGINRAAYSLPAQLQDKLVAVAEAHDDLAPQVPAMTPPALNSVGDKLHDAALADAISRQGPPHRPYLLVQMPKFNLTTDQLASLTAYFTATDRIPRGAGVPPAIQDSAGETPAPRLLAAGPRLVTTDGLACTSCHQVGSVLPSKAPLNARGPDMSMLGKRIRREWFDRWCENPARIVPRMEMPAVKIPVRGVLNEKIDDQLAAVWHILNTPGFEPPEPDPVRVLRLSGVPEKNERPIVIHDVFKDGDKTYLYPLVIGLPNRHNVLFDLETNRLAAWWLGDTARQRTRGKYWFWEPGGKSILDGTSKQSEMTLTVDDVRFEAIAPAQFVAELVRWGLSAGKSGSDDTATAAAATELHFRPTGTERQKNLQPIKATVVQMFQSEDQKRGAETSFVRNLNIVANTKVTSARFTLVDSEIAAKCKWDNSSRTLSLPAVSGPSITVLAPQEFTWNGDGSVTVSHSKANSSQGTGVRHYKATSDDGLHSGIHVRLRYTTTLPNDLYLATVPPPIEINSKAVAIAPGLDATRLPLADDIMPSALSWNRKGELVFGTLKGQLFRAIELDNPTAYALQLIADGLATPYGVHAGEDFIDVAAKDGLLRIADIGNGANGFSVETEALGWGRTDDYHDWAVGLIPGGKGEYYVALPCQQDQRSVPAAELRGKFLKLVPRQHDLYDPRKFDIEVISAGHRFPMGMARNREGELFVTDNQGNYNPFNELNHVRKGAHFGFINALEKQNGFVPPPLTPPAISIPHPWTRSVNGICFLDTPSSLAGTKPGPGAPGASLLPAKSLYGPFEGHLVGCEYDTRRLIRMSLQKIGDTYQGCAYPLSIPPEDVEKGLLGPIVCAIKPTTGELYVGEIRDSGWGAANNIGQIVKIKIEPEKLPCGIAEVRATSTGFTIDFIQPVDRAKAENLDSYSIQSYRRESTPAYGGPDLDRRAETITAIALSSDAKRATLTLPSLRPGHVYELQLKNLAPAGAMFHPDQAHYTLNQIPQ